MVIGVLKLFLKNEIECLEKTLTKRFKEFREVDVELNSKKHSLLILKESKRRVIADYLLFNFFLLLIKQLSRLKKTLVRCLSCVNF